MFSKNSRYATVETLTHLDEAGREIRHKAIRFIDTPAATARHRVREHERLDHLAHRYYRDPERFWRIADGNLALWPPDLTADPGRELAIPPA